MRLRKFLVLATLSVFVIALVGAYVHHIRSMPEQFLEIDSSKYPSLGSLNAPVELVVFEDFLCPSCHAFSTEVIPLLKRQYVQNGIVRLVIVPVVLIPDSKMIANAAFSVFSQSPKQFFLFVEKLQALSETLLNEEELSELASSLQEIDGKEVLNSMKEGRYDRLLDENLQLAQQTMKDTMQVPAVFLNGLRMHRIDFDNLSHQIETKKLLGYNVENSPNP